MRSGLRSGRRSSAAPAPAVVDTAVSPAVASRCCGRLGSFRYHRASSLAEGFAFVAAPQPATPKLAPGAVQDTGAHVPVGLGRVPDGRPAPVRYSAVSKKVTPRSTAVRISEIISCRSGLSLYPPVMLMQPSPIAETSRPLVPKVRRVHVCSSSLHRRTGRVIARRARDSTIRERLRSVEGPSSTPKSEPWADRRFRCEDAKENSGETRRP